MEAGKVRLSPESPSHPREFWNLSDHARTCKLAWQGEGYKLNATVSKKNVEAFYCSACGSVEMRLERILSPGG